MNAIIIKKCENVLFDYEINYNMRIESLVILCRLLSSGALFADQRLMNVWNNTFSDNRLIH
jgi:hypothetical protein